MKRADQSLSDQAFCTHLNQRIDKLMSLAVYVSRNASTEGCFTRPLLADLLSESSKIEELLDTYGVKNNRHWFPLRQAVAPIKLFSRVGYILIHILRFLPDYQLLPITEDFPKATGKALSFTCSILIESATTLIRQAKKLGIHVPESAPPMEEFGDELLNGHLAGDRRRQEIASPEETVVYLATAFLNLAEQSTFLHAVQNQQVDNYADWIPDPISEERLRNLEEMFHNLQSLYDTHISNSNVETLDDHLPVLRGHITVIYHLLETATAFAHYCERHVLSFAPYPRPELRSLIDPNKLLDVLINYSVAFASRYISRTRSLCHDMLRRYAIQGRITVAAPRYRGFHVRPSTLVAKIVSHYGSEVQMKLGGETYNAGVTLDLFRANEKINAGKKRWLRSEVHKLGLDCGPGDSRDASGEQSPEETAECMINMAHSAIQSLFVQNKLMLYERNLPLDEIKPLPDESVNEYITRALIQLLTMGKIDVVMDINVTFSGDQRVLRDIKLLAESGYGEDDYGNNLPLPDKLSYLRR
ncbi:MAG: hypothetical protein JXB06_14825 [Spirochaetales bacterium]|nr:hypothetical protein [Spirochaetales bacterium]